MKEQENWVESEGREEVHMWEGKYSRGSGKRREGRQRLWFVVLTRDERRGLAPTPA